jgi:hypothetical protein
MRSMNGVDGGEVERGPCIAPRPDSFDVPASVGRTTAIDRIWFYRLLHSSPLFNQADLKPAEMQSTRSLAAGMLRQQTASSMLRTQAMPMLRNQQLRSLRLQAAPKMRMPVPVWKMVMMY